MYMYTQILLRTVTVTLLKKTVACSIALYIQTYMVNLLILLGIEAHVHVCK